MAFVKQVPHVFINLLTLPFKFLLSLLFIPLSWALKALPFPLTRDLGEFFSAVTEALRTQKGVDRNPNWWMQKKVRLYEKQTGKDVTSSCGYFWVAIYMSFPQVVRELLFGKIFLHGFQFLTLLGIAVVLLAGVLYFFREITVIFNNPLPVTSFLDFLSRYGILYGFLMGILASVWITIAGRHNASSKKTKAMIGLLGIVLFLIGLPIFLGVIIFVLSIVAGYFGYKQLCPTIRYPKQPGYNPNIELTS